MSARTMSEFFVSALSKAGAEIDQIADISQLPSRAGVSLRVTLTNQREIDLHIPDRVCGADPTLQQRLRRRVITWLARLR